MKKILILFTVLVIAVSIIPSCKKKKGCTDAAALNYDAEAEEDDGSCLYKKKGCMDTISLNYDPQAEVDDGSCRYAGIGGNTTIVAKPQHHGVPVIGMVGYVDSAFVKFNTQVFPGDHPALYDLVIAGDAGEDHIHLDGLKTGKYFILLTGFDSTINQRVVGGLPFILTQDTGTIELIVPITE